MGVDAKLFPDLLGLLYDGLLCPDRWNDFLAELRKQLDCEKAAITFHDPENQTPTVGFSMGWPQEEMREWSAYYGSRNPRALEGIRTALRTGFWISASSLFEIGTAYRNSEYARWLQRCGGVHHVLLTGVPCGPAVATLSFTRPRSAKPFSQSGQKLMRLLVPHLQRVLQIHSRNETVRTLFEAGKIALDTLDAGVVAVDEQGRVVLTNEQAETALEKGHAITTRRGRLAATHSSEAAGLERLVHSAAMTGGGRGTENGGVITIHGEAESAPMSVIVTPFRSNRILAEGRPCALAFICDPAAKPAPRAAALRSLFGLTPAECRLAGLLHEGLELRLAAQRMGVTAATARFMLKRIFSKTGSHRQSELIQLLNRLPGEVTGGRSVPRLRSE